MPLNKTRLTYLWLLPLNFAPPPCPSSRPFLPSFFSPFFAFSSFFLFVDFLYFLSLFLPSFPSILQSFSLDVFTIVRVGVVPTSVFILLVWNLDLSSFNVRGETSTPFGTPMGSGKVILLPLPQTEWIRIPFESRYLFVADVSRRKINLFVKDKTAEDRWKVLSES